MSRSELEKLSTAELARRLRECDRWDRQRHRLRSEIEQRYRRWGRVLELAWWGLGICLLLALVVIWSA